MEQALDQTWERFDADGSGQIERSEMRTLLIEMAQHMGVETTEEAIDEKFKEMDVDNNGSISKTEMKPLIRQIFN